MAFAITTIGETNDLAASGSTTAISVPAGGVPAGAAIIMLVCDRSATAPGGSVADTAGNSYVSKVGANLNAVAANGFGAIFTTHDVAALVSGNSITYTKSVSGSSVNITASYITGAFAGVDPVDSAVTASSSGNSMNPTVTSGVPGLQRDIFIGAIAAIGGSGTFNQDSNWSSGGITNSVKASTANSTIVGGRLISTDALAKTFAPSFTSTATYAAMIIALSLPSVSGTGDATAAAPTADAAAVLGVSGSGDGTAAAPTGDGSGKLGVTASGDGTAAAPTGDGTASETKIATGDATAPAPTSDASITLGVSGSGDANAPAPVADGSAVLGVTGSGDGVASAPGASGSATETKIATGDASAPSPAADGDAASLPAGIVFNIPASRTRAFSVRVRSLAIKEC